MCNTNTLPPPPPVSGHCSITHQCMYTVQPLGYSVRTTPLKTDHLKGSPACRLLHFSSALSLGQTSKPNCITMPMVKLVYFNIRAKAELIRHLLNAGNIDYEDFHVHFLNDDGSFSTDEWYKLKPSTPFGQLPLLYWDGEEIAQSMAMVRFVARKVGLAGKSDMEFAQADMIACHYEDIWTKLPKLRFAKTQEERETLAAEFLNEFMPKWLTPLENTLKKRGGTCYAGASTTFADLAIMVALDFLQDPADRAFKDMNNIDARCKILDDFPLVKANYQRTCALPFVAAWRNKRPASNGF